MEHCTLLPQNFYLKVVCLGQGYNAVEAIPLIGCSKSITT